MKTLRTELVIFVDVDDTLVMHKNVGGNLPKVCVDDPIETDDYVRLYRNEPIIRLLREKHQRGYTIIVWSLGGFQWAENVVKALDLTDIVSLVMSKPLAYVDDKDIASWLTHRVYLDPDINYKTEPHTPNKG